MRADKFLIGCSALVLAANAGEADVVISKKATANMSCSAGMCSPTAAKAVLNATDLANMLAGGDVKVITGSGATNIVVKDAFSWTSASRLTLDAIQSVEFDKPVTVAGTGAVTIATNDGGSGGDLLFGDKGSLTFWDLSSSLIINGSNYTLVGDIKTLAADIAANPSGFYALANDYDASVDGTYSTAPIDTGFDNTIEGLNHKVDHVTVNTTNYFAGFFAGTDGGVLRDFQVTNASIQGSGGNGGILMGSGVDAVIVGCFATGTLTVTGGDSYAGGLAGNGSGTIDRSHADASINAAQGGHAGGLVGTSDFAISRSFAAGTVRGGDNATAGGLVGQLGSGMGGSIVESFATGAVWAGDNAAAGGLIGSGSGSGMVDNSYALATVKAGANANVGGFAGLVSGIHLHHSYSTGFVKGGQKGVTRGGFIGYAQGSDSLGFDYWDTQTSGESRWEGVGTCEDPHCAQNVKGLKTEMFLSALPPGFDPNIWGQKSTVNGGYPYLLSLPPK